MHARWIQLPFDPDRGGFDEAPLAQALSARSAAAVREYFFAHEGRPYLGCFVEWDEDEGRFLPLRSASTSTPQQGAQPEMPAGKPRATAPKGRSRSRRSRPQETELETDFAAPPSANSSANSSASASAMPDEDETELDPVAARAAEALRRWRSARAKALGVPAYRLLTNRQLVTLARSRPTTLAALLEIPGLGAGRVATHGEEFLGQLRAAESGMTLEAAPTEAAPTEAAPTEAAPTDAAPVETTRIGGGPPVESAARGPF